MTPATRLALAALLLSACPADLVAGQSVVIVVDGYQGASGPFVLNISQGAAIVGGDDPDLVLAKQHN